MIQGGGGQLFVFYMHKKILFLLIFLVMTGTTVFASDDLTNWRFSRKINNTSKGYQEILLDEIIYKNANTTLEDIRIIDSNNELVPYYISNSTKNDNFSIKTYNALQILQFQKK